MLKFNKLTICQGLKRLASSVWSRLFSKSGMKPNRTFNAKLLKELFGIVAEAA